MQQNKKRISTVSLAVSQVQNTKQTKKFNFHNLFKSLALYLSFTEFKMKERENK